MKMTIKEVVRKNDFKKKVTGGYCEYFKCK